jgi:hypothetical protein
VEAKAGTTVAGDMLNTVRKIHTELHRSAASEACLVYGRDTAQKRSDVIVLPWHELHTHIWPDT